MRSNWAVALLAVILVAASAGLMVYILDNQGGEAEHGGATAEQSPAPAAGGPLAVTIKNFAYMPNPITGSAGLAVTWTQQDLVAHTITSGARGAATAGSLFDREVTAVGQTFSFTFANDGTFPYFCRFHENMNATATIGAAAQAAAPTPTPAPQFTQLAPNLVIPAPASATLVARGLENPRGFTWGPDGAMYVAEAGANYALNLPGTQSASQRVGILYCDGWRQLDQPAPPTCPQDQAQYATTGRVSRIAPDGTRTTVADRLPVIIGMFGFAEGPASVAFVGNTLYVVITHTIGPLTPGPFNTGVYRINPDASGTLIAALDNYVIENPPLVRAPDYGVSEPHDMVAWNNKLYVSDGNAGVIFEVDPAQPQASNTRFFADLSALGSATGHPVLTGLALGRDNNLYVTNLSKAPYTAGSALIWRVTPEGQIAQVTTGLTLATGLTVAPDGTQYVAELGRVTGGTPPVTPVGRIVRVRAGGQPEPVMDNVLYPTMMRWGPDGALYATYFSLGADNGTAPGAIFRINVGGTSASPAPAGAATPAPTATPGR